MNKDLEEIRKALPLMNERMKGEFIGAARALLMLKEEKKHENGNKADIQSAGGSIGTVRDLP